MLTEGKSSRTLPEIEPGTSRLVAHCLIQLRIARPRRDK